MSIIRNETAGRACAAKAWHSTLRLAKRLFHRRET